MSAVEDATASLSFYGDELDPDEVTRLLGCVPTSLHYKGAPFSLHPKSGIARLSSWHLESALPRSTDLEIQINSLLDQLSDDIQTWQGLTERFDARVFCGIFMDVSNEGFILSPQLLQRLGARGLRVDFDIYGPVDKETETPDAEGQDPEKNQLSSYK